MNKDDARKVLEISAGTHYARSTFHIEEFFKDFVGGFGFAELAEEVFMAKFHRPLFNYQELEILKRDGRI